MVKAATISPNLQLSYDFADNKLLANAKPLGPIKVGRIETYFSVGTSLALK